MAKRVWKHSPCVYGFGWYNTLYSYNINGSNRQAQRFYNQRITMEKPDAHGKASTSGHIGNWLISKAEVTLQTSMTVPLMDECRDRGTMDKNEPIYCIILFTAGT